MSCTGHNEDDNDEVLYDVLKEVQLEQFYDKLRELSVNRLKVEYKIIFVGGY